MPRSNSNEPRSGSNEPRHQQEEGPDLINIENIDLDEPLAPKHGPKKSSSCLDLPEIAISEEKQSLSSQSDLQLP